MNQFVLQALFAEYQRNLDFFFNRIDFAQVEKIVDLFLHCPGTLVFTGVGKSGIIAEKLALTMISTGTKALFLPPSNALHGDIGIVSPQDVVILLSKSGESEELLQLIPYIRQRGAKTVGWVLSSESKLMQECDLTIALPFQKELCPFDLAPTTSTAIQLIFGDVLSVALMKAKGFGLDDYALNHPAGTLGKKMNVKVKDLMLEGKHIPLCQPQDRLSSVLVELTAKRSGCLVVVDEKKQLKGVFTDGDLRRALQENSATILDKTMEDLMTTDCVSTTKEERAWNALRLMQRDKKRWVMVVPVIEDKRVVGLIRMHDIVQAGIR
ncbi:MAG: KpsF/GutQ family sugar-phosphate isomerase [Chlamydiota bacterium]